MADKIKMSEIRAKFPMYDDLPDYQLLAALHKQYYSDIDRGEFLQSVDDDISRAKNNPTNDMSTYERTMAGIGSGMSSVGRALGGKIFAKALGVPETKEAAAENDRDLLNTRAGRLGNVGGHMVATLPAAFIPGVNTYAGAAAVGAGVGALTTEGDLKDRAVGAATGGVAGPVGKFAGDTIARGIRGLVPRSSAAMGLPTNVANQTTLGQVADRGTLAGRIASATEEKLKSVPLIGQFVERARERGAQAWRNDLMERGSPEGFQATGDTVRDRLASAYGEFRRRYTDTLQSRNVGPSQLFEQQAQRIATNPRSGLSQEQGEQVLENVMRNYRSRFEAQPVGARPQVPQPGAPTAMRGDTAKDFEAFLGDQARQYGRTQGVLNPEMANVYGDLERAWSTAYRRQLGPQVRAELRPLDQRYAPYKTLERAAASVGNEAGAFTPAQLVSSVANRTGKARFGRGDGILADEAQAGKTVFQDHIANSGTTDRALQAGTLGGLVLDPATTLKAYGASAAAIPLFTSQAGKRAMTGQTQAQLLAQRLRMPDVLEELMMANPAFGAQVNAQNQMPREQR